MKFYTFYCFLLLSIFYSCSSKNNSKSNIIIEDTRNAYYLDDMVKDYSLLTLKDDSFEGLIGRITKIIIDDDLIFLSHVPSSNYDELQQVIGVYDFNGNYLHGIGHKGRASNEYQAIRDWSIDIINKEVLIYDSFMDRIQKYSYDGSFKSSITLNDEEISRGYQLFCSNSRIYIQSMLPNEYSDDITRIINSEEIKNLTTKREISTNNFYIQGITQYSSPGNDTLYHIRPLDNLLYKIVDQECFTAEVLEFIKIPTVEKMKSLTMNDTDYLMEIPTKCFDTKSYYIVKTIDDGIYALSKRKGRWIRYIEEGITYKTHLIPNSIVGVTDDILIGYFTSKYASDGLKYNKNLTEKEDSILRAMAKSENPTLIFYKLN